MIKRLLYLLLLFNITTFSQVVVINELDCDTPGTDALEFIELKSSSPNFSLNGYVLVFFNAGSSPYTSSFSYSAIDLDGYTTDINGNFLIGNAGVSPSPNIEIPGNFIQNGPDGIAIFQGNASDFPNNTLASTTNLVHAITYATISTQPTNLISALGNAVFINENINTAKDTQSIQRKSDGSYEVKAPTPGVNNDGSGIPINYVTVSFSQTTFKEGDGFNIIFTTSKPVTGSNLIMNFTLANGTFTNLDFAGGLTVSIPVGETTTQNGIIISNDGINEGDEEFLFKFQPLPSGYVAKNDNIIKRVNEVNYVVQPWGTPLNPTYGLCPKQIPNGYYDSLEGKSGNQLKQAIQDIIANPLEVRYQTYGDVWQMLKEADTDPRNSSNVWLMYVEYESSKLNQQTGTTGAVGFWNREHIYCQSRGDFDNGGANSLDTSINGIDNYTLTTGADDIYAGGSDAHHIRAEDSPENSSRNNKNYGIDLSGTDDYDGPTGNAGSWKGDVARAVFYMAVRYKGLNVVNGFPSENPTGFIGDLSTLLAWNKNDTADDFEVNRNNVIYNWQKNRNPFIDYPTLVDYVFGDKFGQTWNATLANETFNQLDLVMYPNPTNGSIKIAGLNSLANIEIFSLTGQKVLETKYESNSILDLSLSGGIYMVKISEGNKFTTKKLVIK